MLLELPVHHQAERSEVLPQWMVRGRNQGHDDDLQGHGDGAHMSETCERCGLKHSEFERCWDAMRHELAIMNETCAALNQ